MTANEYRMEAHKLHMDGAQLVIGGEILAGLLLASAGKTAYKKAIALEKELKGVSEVTIDTSFPDCPFVTGQTYTVDDELLTYYVSGKLNFTV